MQPFAAREQTRQHGIITNDRPEDVDFVDVLLDVGHRSEHTGKIPGGPICSDNDGIQLLSWDKARVGGVNHRAAAGGAAAVYNGAAAGCCGLQEIDILEDGGQSRPEVRGMAVADQEHILPRHVQLEAGSVY